MRLLWGLSVLSAAAIIGAAIAADLLIHAPSSPILRNVRRWRRARYLASQGLPADCDEKNAQRFVAAKLRSDAVKTFGVTEQEWREFCDAHPLTQVGGAS